MKLIQLLKELEIGNPNQIFDTKSSINKEFNQLFRQLKRIDPQIKLKNNHHEHDEDNVDEVKYANIIITFSNYESYKQGTKLISAFIHKHWNGPIDEMEGNTKLKYEDFDTHSWHYLIDYHYNK